MQIPYVVIAECQRRVYGMMEETAQAKHRLDRAKRGVETRQADYDASLLAAKKMIEFLVDNASDQDKVKGELEAMLAQKLDSKDDHEDDEEADSRKSNL